MRWGSNVNAVLLKVPTLIIALIEGRAKIGKYVTENGPARAARHFSVPETAAKRAKTEYFRANLPNLKTNDNFFR